MRLDFGFHARWKRGRLCLASYSDHNGGPQTGGPHPKETDMLLPWTSALILFSIAYGLFVLIALRGLCGVINDQLTALRTARAARSASPAVRAKTADHIVLPGFAAVHAEA
jgi:hypothetical protein